jgi:Zn-finger nucleic acid-binding protein
MRCPHCPDTALLMTDRQGIEIDYCPNCRGVWLDRGELDKLIERAATVMAPPQAAPQAHAPQQHAPQHPQHHPQQHHGGYQKPYYGKHKKSWLSEIFD